MIKQRFEKKVQDLIDKWHSEYLWMSDAIDYVNLDIDDERDEGIEEWEFQDLGRSLVDGFAEFMEKTVIRRQWSAMEPTKANIERLERFLRMQAASNMFLASELKARFQVEFYTNWGELFPMYVTDLSQIDFKECCANMHTCEVISVRPVEGLRWTKNKVARVVSYIRNDLGPSIKVAMQGKTKPL
ncbi:MAG TPA: hypothetical protein VLX29_11530, partial [Nitrospirota bacterium]|nr:hypothetical protein [Nitrospirota bacterium]